MSLRNKKRISKDERRTNKKNNHKIWHILMQVYREFATESTVHGIKYTVQAKTTLERILWLIIVIISLVSAGGLANKFYERHESANMRTTVVTNQFPSSKIALPAVTICARNFVSAERLLSFLTMEKQLYIPRGLTISDFEHGLVYLREMIYPSNYLSEELDKLQRILNANRITLPQLLEHVSPTCADLLLMCMYEGQIEACDKLFVPTLTSYGICCSFNNAALKKGKSPRNVYLRRPNLYSTKFGNSYILSVLLKPYNRTDRISSINYGDGYRVMIHDRYSLPGPNALEFMAGTAHETIVGLYGTHLTSSPEILNLPSRQRHCKASTKDHVNRSENCYLKCRNLAVRDFCNCIPFHANELNYQDILCNFTHTPCLARVMCKVYSMSLLDPSCNCLPDCEATKYMAFITGEPFNAARFRPGKFFEKAQKYSNSTALHITFAGQSAVLERRELVLSWINLVSSLGGVFSLFLGCSFISVIEFFYFFIFHLIRKLQKKYKKNASVINLR